MWAGGKTKLLKKYEPFFPKVSEFSTYVEPFFGGGAIYGSLVEDFSGKPFINDSNSELMSIYSALKASPKELQEDARRVLDRVLKEESKEARKSAYYEEREAYWETMKPGELLALMKLGFNGIWQSNKAAAGKFATPAGLLNQKDADSVLSRMDFDGWHKALQKTFVSSVNYSEVEFEPREALVYLDPPYRDSFTTYNTGFSDKEQVEVVEYAKRLAKEGATVLLANRHVEGDKFFEELMPEAEFHSFDVTYTAGRRKRLDNGFEAKKAREFLAVLRPEE